MTAKIEPEGRDRAGAERGRRARGKGGNRSGRDTDGLPRLGGIGALLSGLLFLVTVMYTFVYLARLGLSTEMLDRPRALLPWIANNEGSYPGLWWLYLASLLCLLPVVPTLYRCTPAGRVGHRAGRRYRRVGRGGCRDRWGGDERGERVRAGTGVPGGGRNSARPVGGAQRAFRDLATVLQDVSHALVGLWLFATGVAWMERPARWRARGGALEVLSAAIAGVVASKSVGLLDLEPYLALLTAVAYLWIGTILLREAQVDPSHKAT